MPLRTIESYGGLKVNLLDPEVPESEESAEEGNRKAVDLAMFSSTSTFATVMFITTSTAAPTTVTPTDVTIRSHMGNGSSSKPVVAKTATGIYTVTFPSTYTDAMAPPVTEDIEIAIAKAYLSGTQGGVARAYGWTDNVVTVYVQNTAFTLSDLSGVGRVVLDVQF